MPYFLLCCVQFHNMQLIFVFLYTKALSEKLISESFTWLLYYMAGCSIDRGLALIIMIMKWYLCRSTRSAKLDFLPSIKDLFTLKRLHQVLCKFSKFCNDSYKLKVKVVVLKIFKDSVALNDWWFSLHFVRRLAKRFCIPWHIAM